MKLKFWLTIIPTLLIFLMIFAFSLFGLLENKSELGFESSSQHAPVAESYFRDARYFLVEPGKSRVSLWSTDLSLAQDGSKLIFLNPDGDIYREQQSPLHYTAKSGIYRRERQHLVLEGNVVINDAQSSIRSDNIIYQQKDELIKARGEVWTEATNLQTKDKVQIQADALDYKIKTQQGDYTGKVKGLVLRVRPYEDSVKFESSRLFMDLPASLLTLNNDVLLKKQNMTASAQKGEIFLENYNKKLKYFALYDDVKVDETVKSGGRTFKRQAFGQKLEGLMSEGRLILTGFPRVLQLRDVIQGNRIVLRENNEVVEVDDASTNFEIK